ncbi:MAG: hypothetical protein OXH51_04700 [Gemmatimonadetes bacterium]|nr:hypothetical protein [Gemmatimonadota bacterium]
MSIPIPLTAALLACCGLVAATPAQASDPGAGGIADRARVGFAASAATTAPLQAPGAADSADAHSRARSLQTRFERRRVRDLPRTLGGGSHPCDAIIGRLCIWDDGNEDWEPREEPESIRDWRLELLTELASLARAAPGDHWIFGQRIRYSVEAGLLAEAEALARGCGLPVRWRCDAFLGYVQHHQEDFVGAESAFARALSAMPADTAGSWADPHPLLDGELRDWLEAQPDSAAAARRLWTLADPLYLADGNERWSAHLSRRVYAMSSDGAMSPHQLRWGKDMTEAVVRYGWPIAWERSWPRAGQSTIQVTGRDPPASARTLPPRDVLDGGPDSMDAVVWEVPDGHAQSVYLPTYVDTIGSLDGQTGRFWRRDGVILIGVATLPDPPAGIPHPEPNPPPAALPLAPVEAGLFVETEGVARTLGRAVAETGDVVRLSGMAPLADRGVVSLEAWAPGHRRAHRIRLGIGLRRLPPDLLAISDLVLLEPGAEPADLEPMLDVVRASTHVAADEDLTVAFEVYGLGFRAEGIGFSAWVERRNEGALSRFGRWLRVRGPREEVSIRWEESGPERPQPLFRTLRLGLPGLDPGEYQVVLEVSVAGRAPLVGRRAFTVW